MQGYKLKKYANENGIKIIGDIPIYVAYDSAVVWAHPELFQMDENGKPVAVAGCPPDGFQQQDNYGEIHYTDGIIISKQIMIGG